MIPTPTNTLRLTILLLLALSQFSIKTSAASDTTKVSENEIVSPQRSLVNRVVDYFGKANVPRTDGKLDVSFIGGPHFSSDTKLGVGIVAAGRYGYPVYNSDSTREIHSEASLYLDASITGFVKVGLQGTHIFDGDRSRVNYDLNFSNFPGRYWGIGYAAGHRTDDYTKFNQIALRAMATYEHRLAGDFFMGPMIDYSLISAKHIQKMRMWRLQETTTSFVGVGAIATIDTRDNITSPKNGYQVRVEANYYPKFTSRPHISFSNIVLSASIYRPLWRNATLASRFHAQMTTGNVPWSMMATFGGSTSMRGYFEGQYRDKDEMDLTLELRQKVWRRSGAVAWVGAGTVFPKFSHLTWQKVLPNYGIGYRWEFKRNSNVRIDFGAGWRTTAFIFSINEAF